MTLLENELVRGKKHVILTAYSNIAQRPHYRDPQEILT